MSTLAAPPDHFDLSAPAGGELMAVANALCARAAQDPTLGEVVVVARTASGELRGVGSRTSPVPASVSVAVAGGHDRLWADSHGTDTVEVPIHALPEVVRIAAAPIGYTHAHVGCVRDDEIAAVAVWFTTGDSSTSSTDRSEAMQLLTIAAQRQHEFFEERDRAASERAAAEAAVAEDTGRTRSFDPDDPNVDATTGLVSRTCFEETLDEFEGDEATLVVVDLDEFDAVVSEHGAEGGDAVLRELADRLLDACRRDDVIARLGDASFAVLLHDASRAVGLQVAKRLLGVIADPLVALPGSVSVTATIAMAHQFGLVDTEELIESADLAVASGKRAGSNRLVIAS